ncbi:MAG: division/cell wall cluster transcriptional repressor MraZ [Actinobacteria bacterium]|jgi:MraZ protein|nr:division/cell wall cluster transcriptional repressor MraZ [Actinomycetota bacterium]
MQRPLLVGEYEFTLDAKNRIAVPARLRSAFVDGIYITRWYEDSLAGFSPAEFERYLEEQAGATPPMSSKGRSQLRFLAAGAVADQLDRQGRVTIPARLLDYAAITREVTIVGVRDHIEIWERSAWARYLKSLEEGADAIADELAAS